MEKEEILFLNQLVLALQDAERSLEKVIAQGNQEGINKTVLFMKKVQKKIEEVTSK